MWNKWKPFKIYNIKQRKFNDVNVKTLPYIIRLSSAEKNNSLKNNHLFRMVGLYLLINEIKLHN